MSDILFACPKCTKSLAVDELHSGVMVNCVDCQFPVRVPLPAVWFQCSSCRTDLAAPRIHMGKIFRCSNCNTDVPIPTQVHSGTKEEAVAPVEPKPEPASAPIERGVKLPGIDDETRKRMISNMFSNNDKMKEQLKNAHEPKIVKFTKRVLLYAIVSFILWLLTYLMFGEKIACVVLTASIGIEIFILIAEMVLFRGVYE